MPFEFVCPFCHCKTKVLDRFAGQSGPCVECGKRVTMPHFNERGVLVPSIKLNSKPVKLQTAKDRSWMPAIAGVSMVLTILLVGGVILRLAWPSLTNSMRRVAQARDLENMKSIAKALNAYCDRYGSFPPPAVLDASGKRLLSWRVLILPFLGYEDLYKRFELTQSWDSPTNMNLVSSMPNEFASPNSPDAIGVHETNYVLITGPGTLFPSAGPMGKTNIDSHTLLLVETKNNTVWSKPGDYDSSLGLKIGNKPMNEMGGLHRGSFTAVTVEEESMRIPSDVSPVVLDAIITPNGGENVQTSTFME